MAKRKRIIPDNDVEIHQSLFELRREGREKFLEISGIDVSKARRLEEEIDTRYDELAIKVRNMQKDAGKGVAENHVKSQERTRMLISKEVETRLAELAPGSLKQYPFPHSWCFYWNIGPVVDSGQSVTLEPQSGGTGQGSVTFDTDSIAHPFADVRGQGTGTINKVKVNTWFKFAFMPVTGWTYCVRPVVQMNGHWLAWTWGTCGGTAESVGSGAVRITLKVHAGQLFEYYRTIEHHIINETLSAGSDNHTGWYYDSEVDGGAFMTVNFQEGHEAVIKVECEIYAEIVNHGRAWIDLQTSPQFYFKVPEVYCGPSICLFSPTLL